MDIKEFYALGEKVEYKKTFKHIYLPKNKPEIIDVPKMPYIMISGTGDPNGQEFSNVTEALYSLSYAVKMSYKGKDIPDGYYEYTVFPLEGVWDLIDKSVSPLDKSNFKYTIMMRQPDFLTNELLVKFLEKIKVKKPSLYLEKVSFSEMTDGMSCQIMHSGSYDNEPESFATMQSFCEERGYLRTSKTHREIYLSDPRKTDAINLKTVLRFPVRLR
jgi:hypothetical protein